jgi:hypothetical protein
VAISFQLSAFSHQLSAISFQPSAFSHQLSAFEFRLGGPNRLRARRLPIGRTTPPRRAEQPADQAAEHSFDFNQNCKNALLDSLGDENEIEAENRLALEFAGRPHRDVQETPEFTVASPSAPLGDIAADRHAGPSHLTSQAESLALREVGGHLIDGFVQVACTLPDIELPEVLHHDLLTFVSATADCWPLTADN